MKKAFIILSAAVLSLGAVSCEDWLEMPPYNATDSETIFSSEGTAEAYVEGCYRGMISKEMYYQLGSGDCVVHASEDAAGGSKNAICNFYYDSKTPYTLTTSYKESYRIIEATNIGIYNLLQMPQTDKTRALLAECYCIRAFMYYNLIRIYGDMPAVWQPMETMDPNAEETFHPYRASRDEIYDHIIADMQGSIDALPTKADGAYGGSVQRLTRDGAYALLARISLYAAGYSLRWDLKTNDPGTLKVARRADADRVRELYQIASSACEKVMTMAGNGLVQASGNMTAFHNLWYSYDSRSFATSNLEMLWQQACYGTNTNSDFNRYAHPGSRYGTYGTEKAMQVLLPTYYLSFDEKDQRRDVTCTPYSSYSMTGKNLDSVALVGTTYSCITLGKFRQQWRVQSIKAATEMNMDIPILRYADVLLGYAEAQNFLNNGPTAQAKDALQQVRTRAGIGDMPIPSDMEGFTEALAQERKWEFAGELWLRTDLIRLGELTKQVQATQTAMRQLSAQEGVYSNTTTYRLYKLTMDPQQWADKTVLTLEHVDVTDDAEVAVVSSAPSIPASKNEGETQAQFNERVAAAKAAYQASLKPIVEAHGHKWDDKDQWYACNMFEGIVSDFNNLCRQAVGFKTNKVHIGTNVSESPTGKRYNKDKYPVWIYTDDNSDGIYFGFKENCCELLPLADASEGHPRVDNPNLSQHPGYLK